MNAQNTGRFWRRRARIAAARHNFAAWLALFLPVAFALSAAFAGALLIMRKAESPLHFAWIGFAIALFAAAIGGFVAARRRFFHSADSLVRFDAVLHLHNRLTAAASGIGEWPAPAEIANDGFRWRWEKLATPLAGSLLLIFAAAWIPLGSKIFAPPHPTEQPIAWTQLESWIDKLADKNLVSEQVLEKLREQIEELKKQPAENWFSHSSLEAGDSLRQQTEQSLRELKRDLEKASAALSAAEQTGGQPSPENLKAINDALQEALKGLELGNLPLNKDLLSELKNIDPNNLKQLSPEQLKELMKQLKEGGGVCKNCLDGEKIGEGLLVLTEQEADAGGTGGGNGASPMGLKPQPTDLGTLSTEKISGDDLSHAAPGEVLGVTKGKHEVDPKKYAGPTEAGAVASPGQGGEAVWRNSLTPQERGILQRFFK